jgi:hypothetical protein
MTGASSLGPIPALGFRLVRQAVRSATTAPVVWKTLLLATLALLLSACGSSHHATAPDDTGPAVEAAVRLCDPGDGSSLARARECYQRRLLALVSAGGEPATELPQVDAAVEREGGYLADNCHILMHWVGRNYALEHHVTLGTLQRYLPRTNDPGCSAGFAHGLISALGSSISRLDPRSVAAACARSATRYQAYSCVHGLGHAYMRAYNEELPLALRMCGRLPRADVVDCAQGAFHDYWFAATGTDGLFPRGRTASPRVLCGRQAQRFVRACWYRAFMESPPNRALNTPADLAAVCSGLRSLQREGCITGASAIFNSGLPDRQVTGCASLAPTDRVACARGVATQDLTARPLGAKVHLVALCDRFGRQRSGCVAWLAKALNVDTDGAFRAAGCPGLPVRDRAACRAGAASWRGPLETFS